jgi:hypothetical protein
MSVVYCMAEVGTLPTGDTIGCGDVATTEIDGWPTCERCAQEIREGERNE